MFRVVEPETESQFENIYDLRYAVLRAPWKQPRGSERDDMEQSAVHALIEDEAGTCIATGRIQFNTKDEAQIRFMAVHPDYRGKGLGKLILEFLEQKAAEHKRCRIVLQSRESAVSFYEALGYAVEAKTFFLFDAIQHYRMSKTI
ncbi:MAG TPA: GNAT family N-acetyltransferase [Bacteroidia bacterium]|nr:GNAT family N-acetyltransferase [Bacteroidia bacterium]